MNAVLYALTEILNRDNGKAFLLPSLSKACGFPLSLDRINRNLTVSFLQEGSDSGIFKVEAKVNTADQGAKRFSFCLNIARNPRLNDLHAAIYHNLKRLRESDGRFVVEPFCLDAAASMQEGRKIELAVFSAEWLKGYTEVNMFNEAEAVDGEPAKNGFEPLGLRRLRFNYPGRDGFLRGIIRDRALADEIASEMVKILTLYFDPQTEEAVGNYAINAGDFVYRAGPGGAFSLKLVTCRQIIKFPAAPSDQEHLRAFIFLDDLFRHRENSVHHQEGADPIDWRRYAIFTFTPTDICRGIKKALIERQGAEKARPMVLNWLAAYIAMDRLAQEFQPPGTREIIFRQAMIKQEIEAFLQAEGYPLGRIVVEI